MEAASSFHTLASFYWNTGSHIPEQNTLK